MPVELGTGMLICAASPGSPIGTKLTQVAGDVPVAVGLGVMLIGVSVATTPAVASLILPAGDHVRLSFLEIVQLLVPHVLLPLAVAVGVKSVKPQWVERLMHPLQLLSNGLFALLVFLVLIQDFHTLATLGLATAGAFVIVGLGSWLIGYALAGTNRGCRLALGFGTGFRNSALALLIAASMRERLIITGVIAYVLLALLVDLLAVLYARRIYHACWPEIRMKNAAQPGEPKLVAGWLMVLLSLAVGLVAGFGAVVFRASSPTCL